MSRYAYSDGTQGDNELYAMKAEHRRLELSGSQVVSRLVKHLEQQIEVLRLDIRRWQRQGDVPRLKYTQERIEWVENLILFMNHNV